MTRPGAASRTVFASFARPMALAQATAPFAAPADQYFESSDERRAARREPEERESEERESQ